MKKMSAVQEIVLRLLEIDPFEGPDPIPTRFTTRPELGGDLYEILRRSPEELLAIRELGPRSLLQFERWVGRKTEALGHRLDMATVQAVISRDECLAAGPGGDEVSGSVAALVRRCPRCIRELDPARLPGLTARVRHAFAHHGIRRFDDLTKLSDRALLGWKNFGARSLRNVRMALRRLRRRAAGVDDAESMSPEDFLRRSMLARPLLESITEAVEALPALQKLIATRRTLAEDRLTLAAVGSIAGLTRERIRQLEDKLLRRLDPDRMLRTVIDEILTRLRSRRKSPLLVSWLDRHEPWFVGVADDLGRFARLLEALDCSFRVTTMEGIDGPFIVPRALAGTTTLVRAFIQEAGPLRTEEELSETLLAFLRECDAPELLPAMMQALGDRVVHEDGLVFDPTLVDRVEAILHRARKPMHITEIMERLDRAGTGHCERSVRAATAQARTINTGSSTYVLASTLRRWNRYRSAVEADVGGLMRAAPERQWSSRDILSVFRDAEVPWAAAMEHYVLDYLLGRLPRFQRLGRRMWCLATAEAPARLRVTDVAREILLEHGRPLRCRELERRVSRRRSLGPCLSIHWPLVRLGRGLIGLGDRDLGLGEASFERLRAAARRMLDEGKGRLDGRKLARLLRTECPEAPELPPRALASLLAASPRIALDGDGDGIRRTGLPRRGRNRA